MALFGRTSCREERNWYVKLYFTDGTELLATEQLNEEEATSFYKDIIKELESPKGDFIEIIKDKGKDDAPVKWTIRKTNIECIKLD